MTWDAAGMDEKLVAYLRSLARPPLGAEEAHRRIASSGDEQIHISPEQGSLLALLVAVRGARRVLELGTHWGYSTLWLASAMDSSGELDTIECDRARGREAATTLASGDVRCVIRQHFGTFEQIVPTLRAPYDLVFVDGEKAQYGSYVSLVRHLLAERGVVVLDNTLHRGRVFGARPESRATPELVNLNRMLTESPEWRACVLPVGDGMTVACRRT
jgi:predicted O-methyltransferase YrrM